MASNDEAFHWAQKSSLFTMRFWVEDMGRGQSDWRAKVQHVNTGEVVYCKDWQTLQSFVERSMSKGTQTRTQE
jgi:hypothetical protein